MNEDKITILVIGTPSMSKKGPPFYYTFELDILFKVRLQSDGEPSNFEFALNNYRLMKNKDSVSPSEEAFIKMMIQRIEFAKKLTPNKMRLRRCWFLLRHMVRTSYISMDL